MTKWTSSAIIPLLSYLDERGPGATLSIPFESPSVASSARDALYAFIRRRGLGKVNISRKGDKLVISRLRTFEAEEAAV